jgi:hypothetical protein
VRRIPKIIKVDLDRGYTNIITNYNTDMAYFTTINSFKLKKCLIGPFSEELDLQYDFSAITIKKLNFEKSKLTRKIINQGYYYEIEMCSDDIINYDLKLSIKSKKVKFYSWFNLWFNTFEIISKYVIKNNYFERERQTESNINRAMSQLEIEEAKKKKESDDMNGVEKKKLSKALGEIISNYDEARGKRKISAIKSMKNNKDLNNILNGIDRLARDLKIPVLDRENLEFTIERKQLDKLKTKLKDPFKVKYTYELLK